MAEDAFDIYLREINKAYLRGDATEHTHRPALKTMIEALGHKITATNEPRRQKCGAPDLLISKRLKGIDETIGYIETKDIGTNLTQEDKTDQLKKHQAEVDTDLESFLPALLAKAFQGEL